MNEWPGSGWARNVTNAPMAVLFMVAGTGVRLPACCYAFHQYVSLITSARFLTAKGAGR
jgi:hypothetical protein